MPDLVINLIVAVAGAVLGALSVLFQDSVARRKEARQSRNIIVQRYLFQFQEAIEGLWHRLENLCEQGGESVMTHNYFSITTLYALGYPMAMERIMVFDAVYPQLDIEHPSVGRWLRTNRIDLQLEGFSFYHYDRISLAEALIERKDDWSRPVMFSDFGRKYESDKVLQDALKPAQKALDYLKNNSEKMHQLMKEIEKIANSLEEVTKIPTTITPTRSKPDGNRKCCKCTFSLACFFKS